MGPLDGIHRLVSRQHGCITRVQATEAGLTPRQIDGLVACREWRRVERGVFQHAAYPITWHSRLFAACHALGGVASHRSAAVLWQLDGCRPGRIEVTVPSTKVVVRSGVTVHRSTQWDRVDETTMESIPVSGLARTIFDLAGVVSQPTLREAANSARRRRQLDWSDLARALVAGARRGRNGSAGLRALLETYAGEQTLSRSEWSDVIADLLVDHGLPRPELEYRVADPESEFVA
ncbi:MAG: hypothetical protein OEV40_11475 [Acidimicrobiia bacterium]|nr:hypothetical protein [Acidimicrobiia bacterium]